MTTAPEHEHCATCGCPAESGPYTHIVKRESGYIAGWFRGEPPADFVPECNANVPDDPAHVEELEGDEAWAGLLGEREETDTQCWNAFCTATDCNGTDHVDVTGALWGQPRGTAYCPACQGYHPAGDCPRGYEGPVTAVYERGPLGEAQAAAALNPQGDPPIGQAPSDAHLFGPAEPSYGPNADGSPYAQYTPESRVWKIAQEHGHAAASWMFDGNTEQETYRQVLKGIRDGDPMIMDNEHEPSLAAGPGSEHMTEGDLLALAKWVPHDGTNLRDELIEQYRREAGQAFWHEVERACLRQLPHRAVDNETQLGNRFITCSCGHRESGGVGDNIAERNFEYHLKTAREA